MRAHTNNLARAHLDRQPMSAEACTALAAAVLSSHALAAPEHADALWIWQVLVTHEGKRGWSFGHPLVVTSGQIIGMLPAGWIPAAFISGTARAGTTGSGGETAAPVDVKGNTDYLSEAARGAAGAECWGGPCRHCPHCAAMLLGSDAGNTTGVVTDTTVEERTNRVLDAVRSFDHQQRHCSTHTCVCLSRSPCPFAARWHALCLHLSASTHGAHTNVRCARA